MQIRAKLSYGKDIRQNIAGPNVNQYYIPESRLRDGVYNWTVMGVCALTAPFGITPLAAPDTFRVGGDPMCPSSVSDIDGYTYPVVEIGGECWLAENLRTVRYRNGDSIPCVSDASSWSGLSSGARSYYDNDSALASEFGALYNWYAVDDARGICPMGWHVPDDDELRGLRSNTGFVGSAAYLRQQGTHEAGTGSWAAPNVGATNGTGFTALPGGLLDASENSWDRLRTDCFLWTTTSTFSSTARTWRILHDEYGLFYYDNSKRDGRTVRCLRD